MNTELMRQQVNAAYNNAPKWVTRTKKMSDQQIMAIYFRFIKDGVIKQPNRYITRG